MGELFALGAAVVWAVAVILFKRSGETVAPFSLNLFRVTVSLVLLLGSTLGARQALWGAAPAADYGILAASGILGIAVADTFWHRGLNQAGAGVQSIVGCLYSPFIVLFAFLILDERLNLRQIAGMALVLGGVLTATGLTPVAGLSRRQLLTGIGWGAAAMATQGIGIVIAKPVLERSPVLWATTMRQIASFAVMLPIALALPGRARVLGVFRPARSWRFTLTGTLLGSFLSLLLWIGGMKYAKAGTAAILNQTSTLFALAFASLFLHEPFTRRKAAAAALALGGILLVLAG